MAGFVKEIEEVYAEEAIQGMGFADAKDFEKYAKKAQSEWKKTKKTIVYSDELSNAEIEYLIRDPEIAKLMKEIEDKQKEAVERIQNRVEEYRTKFMELI